MVFLHFNILSANLSGGKGGTFMVNPGRHLTSLRHWLLWFQLLINLDCIVTNYQFFK